MPFFVSLYRILSSINKWSNSKMLLVVWILHCVELWSFFFYIFSFFIVSTKCKCNIFLPFYSFVDTCLLVQFSLADMCREKPSLDWNRRICIALGTARGLLYLHEQCNPKIIHRDVKAANILLDESFEAVVGDFGLAKLLDRRDSHVTTAVRGTVGHIAPEYLSTGQSSEKTDVFGFGILLLELITGQKALAAGNGQVQKGMILDWVSYFSILVSTFGLTFDKFVIVSLYLKCKLMVVPSEPVNHGSVNP